MGHTCATLVDAAGVRSGCTTNTYFLSSFVHLGSCIYVWVSVDGVVEYGVSAYPAIVDSDVGLATV